MLKVVFFLVVAYGVLLNVSADTQLRGSVRAMSLYHECQIWKRVDDNSQKQLLEPPLGDDESTLLQNINEICSQFNDTLKSMQDQLDGYRDVWNSLMHNAAKLEKTRGLRQAYGRIHKDYYNMQPASPYKVCG